jgi:hypothetical protein
MRAIAGAASRSGAVAVCVPGERGGTQADGAFDLVPVGLGRAGGWPDEPTGVLTGEDAGAIIVVDRYGPDLDPFLASFVEPTAVFTLTGATTTVRPLRLVAGHDGEAFVGLHVPINPLAATHRHNGFGFVDYILVLSGRSGTHEVPPDEVAWVTAAFPEAEVVLVEHAVASVWKGRALRGSTAVDTRTDLWRLIAHARVCIDLAPGETVARECVESLRYGTPILVPTGAGAAAVHARSGGGYTYASMGELVQGVDRMNHAATRQALSEVGRRYADATYGDPAAFTRQVAAVLQPQ